MSALLLRFPSSAPGNAAPLVITNPSPLPAAQVGVFYSVQFVASGGVPPYQNWMLIGAPGWLSINSTGLMSGLPPGAQIDTFQVQVQDSLGAVGAVLIS